MVAVSTAAKDEASESRKKVVEVAAGKGSRPGGTAAATADRTIGLVRNWAEMPSKVSSDHLCCPAGRKKRLALAGSIYQIAYLPCGGFIFTIKTNLRPIV